MRQVTISLSEYEELKAKIESQKKELSDIINLREALHLIIKRHSFKDVFNAFFRAYFDKSYEFDIESEINVFLSLDYFRGKYKASLHIPILISSEENEKIMNLNPDGRFSFRHRVSSK